MHTDRSGSLNYSLKGAFFQMSNGLHISEEHIQASGRRYARRHRPYLLRSVACPCAQASPSSAETLKRHCHHSKLNIRRVTASCYFFELLMTMPHFPLSCVAGMPLPCRITLRLQIAVPAIRHSACQKTFHPKSEALHTNQMLTRWSLYCGCVHEGCKSLLPCANHTK